jgi:hypothetical protein
MTTFPDMIVTMDDLEIGGRSSCDATFHWTLTGTNSGPRGTGKHSSNQRLRTLADRRRQTDRRIERLFRRRRVQTPAQGK